MISKKYFILTALCAITIYSAAPAAAAKAAAQVTESKREAEEDKIAHAYSKSIARFRKTLMPLLCSKLPTQVHPLIFQYLRWQDSRDYCGIGRVLSVDDHTQSFYATGSVGFKRISIPTAQDVQFTPAIFPIRTWITRNGNVLAFTAERTTTLSNYDPQKPTQPLSVDQLPLPHRLLAPHACHSLGIDDSVALAMRQRIYLCKTNPPQLRRLLNPSRGWVTSLKYINGTHLAVLCNTSKTDTTAHAVSIYDITTRSKKPIHSFEFNRPKPRLLPCQRTGTLFISDSDGNLHQHALDGKLLAHYHPDTPGSNWGIQLLHDAPGFLAYKDQMVELHRPGRPCQSQSLRELGVGKITKVRHLGGSEFFIVGEALKDPYQCTCHFNLQGQGIWDCSDNSWRQTAAGGVTKRTALPMRDGIIIGESEGSYRFWRRKSDFELACTAIPVPIKNTPTHLPLTRTSQDSKRAAESTATRSSRASSRALPLAAAAAACALPIQKRK